MRTIICIGYEGYPCGKEVEPTSSSQKRCAPCAKEKTKERQKVLNKKWYEEHREEECAYSRKYHEEHREEKNAYSRKQRKEHRQERKAAQKQWQREHLEYSSVSRHWHVIFNPKRENHKNYVGMPFFDGWNPDKGGSWQAGADWIIANLGKRPEDHSLNIIYHDIGFVPGNLEWAPRKVQNANQLRKLVAQHRHENKELKEIILDQDAVIECQRRWAKELELLAVVVAEIAQAA